MSAIKQITFKTLGEANREALARNYATGRRFFWAEEFDGDGEGGGWVLREMADSFKPAAPTFRITCCECGDKAGETDCEITATSPHHCDQCHNEYLAEVSAQGEN